MINNGGKSGHKIAHLTTPLLNDGNSGPSSGYKSRTTCMERITLALKNVSIISKHHMQILELKQREHFCVVQHKDRYEIRRREDGRTKYCQNLGKNINSP